MKEQPVIRIIAGPNGAGKTTFAREFLPRYALLRYFLNADLMALGLSPFAPETVALDAGRLLLAQIRRLAAQGADFAFETTLSGRSYEPMLRDFQAQGYRLFLYFLWLPDPEQCLQRVAHRVRQGGHNVPESDVRRRYFRGMRNFLNVYRSLVNCWVLYDNSGMWPREISFARDKAPTILDAAAFQRFTEMAGGS